MRIRDVETFLLPPRWLLVRITTDDGLSGWGEGGLEGRNDAARAAILQARQLLIGEDARRIEHLWQRCYRGPFYRGGPVLCSALSGIDQALWDLKGKALGIPVYELLGGAVRDRVRMYAWINGFEPAELAAEAAARMQQGYTAIKMAPVTRSVAWVASSAAIAHAVACVQAVREACGDAFDIGLDFHGRLHKGSARQLLKELETLRPLFVEEPVTPEHNEALAELRQVCAIPIATGERQYTRWGFKQTLRDGLVDIVQPDVSHCGGISEMRRIAAMAEAHDVALAPHCPLGPVSLAASLQVDFCTPNAFIQEQDLQVHAQGGRTVFGDLLESAFHFREGHIERSDAPGLGITINEAYVRRVAETGEHWRAPQWTTADGTVAEW